MVIKYFFSLGIILVAYKIVQISSRVELTNLKCIPIDEKFISFDNCRIKSLNRTYKYFSYKMNLLQVPLTNSSVQIALLKRFNDYRPFLYNVTFDACRFLASKKRNPIYSAFYGFIAQHSNINHTCPFDHDLIVDQVTFEFLNQYIGKMIPLPSGDYALYTSWYAYGINRADIRFYGTIS